MASEPPKSRPEPPDNSKPAKPSVYGERWGSSGKQSGTDKGQTDRPEPIETPPRPTGTPDPETDPNAP